MSYLSLTDANVVQDKKSLLKNVSFSIESGMMVGLVGPNGAGKTTAVRALLGQQKMSSGSAKIADVNVATYTPQALARAIAYLPQTRHLAWPIGVYEAVALGRFAYGGALGRLSPVDQVAIDAAILMCDLHMIARRSVASLSGGELARVHIARALASETLALIADEPIAALDPRHALDVLNLLKAKAKSGAAVLVILHDLNWATRFCDEIILMDQGHVVAQGVPRTILTSQSLADVFGVRSIWDHDELIIQGVV